MLLKFNELEQLKIEKCKLQCKNSLNTGN